MDAKTLCLGVLSLGDASGYEIKKQFEEGPFAHFHAAGFGSIYPALGALSAEGLATCREVAQEGRPPKKVYRITAEGVDAFRRALQKAPAADSFRSEAIFMMFFAEMLDHRHLRDVLDDYVSHYRQHLDRMSAQDRRGFGAGRRFVHGFGLAVYQAAVDYMEDNRDMLLGCPINGADADAVAPRLGSAGRLADQSGS